MGLNIRAVARSMQHEHDRVPGKRQGEKECESSQREPVLPKPPPLLRDRQIGDDGKERNQDAERSFRQRSEGHRDIRHP